MALPALKAKRLSLTFPDWAQLSEATDAPTAPAPVGGFLDSGGDVTVSNDPVSWSTSQGPKGSLRDTTAADIPRPSPEDVAEAEKKNKDPNTPFDPYTGKPWQPKWMSVLVKRQAPFLLLKILTLNCCCQNRFAITRAQWIWLLNLLCAFVHWYFTFMVLQEGLPKAEAMRVPIFRVRATWKEAGGGNSYDLDLHDNNMPIRFELLTAFFFAASAVSHSFVVIFGPFDRWIRVVWRPIDLCFIWWRWVEYSVSAPLMLLGVALLVGIREQNTLACLFVLMATTMMCGGLVELNSRPLYVPFSESGEEGGFYRMSRWSGDDPRPDPTDTKLSYEDRCARAMYLYKRRGNYTRRMAPFVVGLFPFITCWVIVLHHFFQQLEDLRQKDEDLYERVPAWVPLAIIGTCIAFSVWAPVFATYQWWKPSYYWRVEVIFNILSLTSKVLLGSLLYSNVLRAESFEAALDFGPDVNATSLRA